jgi:hypothetical protein
VRGRDSDSVARGSSRPHLARTLNAPGRPLARDVPGRVDDRRGPAASPGEPTQRIRPALTYPRVCWAIRMMSHAQRRLSRRIGMAQVSSGCGYGSSWNMAAMRTRARGCPSGCATSDTCLNSAGQPIGLLYRAVRRCLIGGLHANRRASCRVGRYGASLRLWPMRTLRRLIGKLPWADLCAQQRGCTPNGCGRVRAVVLGDSSAAALRSLGPGQHRR